MKRGTITLYRDTDGKWRWRIKASNGRILADSGEGYSRVTDCRKALNLVIFEANAWDMVTA